MANRLTITIAMLLLAATARATTFVLADEQALARQSTAVLIGEVVDVSVVTDVGSKAISTRIEIEPESVVAGSLPERPVVLYEAGGETPEYREHYDGAPTYTVGERILAFVMRRGDGRLTTTSMAMGKYAVENRDGDTLAIRSWGSGVAFFDRRSSQLETESAPLSYRLADVLASVRGAAAGHRNARRAEPLPAQNEIAADSPDAAEPYTFMGTPSRRFEPDTGAPVPYLIGADGDATLGPTVSRAAVDAAFAAWTNVPTSSLVLTDGGTTNATGFGGCGGDNLILFNDPPHALADPDGCAGVIAIGGFCTNDETRDVHGTSFRRIIVGRVVFNNGWENCPDWNECNFAEVATHEIAHSFGLGHSGSASATMYPYAHFDGRCASVRADDVAAVNFMYPAGSGEHDAVVLPHLAVEMTIGVGQQATTKQVSIKVRDVDVAAGDEIKLVASDGDCPAGTVGVPDFGAHATSSGDTGLVAAGKTIIAKVPITIRDSEVQTPNRKIPRRCSVQLTAQSATPGNIDAQPDNNRVFLEINAVDRNDEGVLQRLAPHQSLLRSVPLVAATIRRGRSSVTKTVGFVVLNADQGETQGHVVTIEAGDGDCPPGTVQPFDFHFPGLPNQVSIVGGKKWAGKLRLSIDATRFTALFAGSPARCTATLSAVAPQGDADVSNDSTNVVIDVIDRNDL